MIQRRLALVGLSKGQSFQQRPHKLSKGLQLSHVVPASEPLVLDIRKVLLVTHSHLSCQSEKGKVMQA